MKGESESPKSTQTLTLGQGALLKGGGPHKPQGYRGDYQVIMVFPIRDC